MVDFVKYEPRALKLSSRPPTNSIGIKLEAGSETATSLPTVLLSSRQRSDENLVRAKYETSPAHSSFAALCHDDMADGSMWKPYGGGPGVRG